MKLKEKILNGIWTVIALSIVFSLLSGCVSFAKSDEEKIKSRLESFTNAYNSGDLEKMLDCMDSKTKNTYKSAINITDSLIGKTGFKINLNDLFGLSVGITSDGELMTL